MPGWRDVAVRVMVVVASLCVVLAAVVLTAGGYVDCASQGGHWMMRRDPAPGMVCLSHDGRVIRLR